MSAAVTPGSTALFAALLRGEAVRWDAFGMDSSAFLNVCREEGLTGLVHCHLTTRDVGQDWPDSLRRALAAEVRRHTVTELMRRQELVSVLAALASAGVRPLIIKGTALAYTHYGAPSSRPRVDTDLLIRCEDTDAVRSVLGECGYTEPNFCGGVLFCQFPMHRTDGFGVVHKFDIHWKISTQPVFADVLTYDEMTAEAVDVGSLGPHARTPGAVHALLLACIHPAMHHRSVESLLWLYDVHLLARGLSDSEFRRFTGHAIARQVSAVCAHQLDAARRLLGTPVPDHVSSNLLKDGREASAAYLRPDRRWIDDLESTLGALPHWRGRLQHLREVAFPPAGYMRRAYDLPRSPLAAVLLPLVYAHRLAAGGWKILAGQK